jgi:hypothetical protein
VRKVCGISVSVFTVVLLSSCVADSKYEPKMNSDISNLQWEGKNGDAALPLAAAMDFCGKEATDESAKIAAVLSLDKKYTAGTAVQLLDLDSLDTVKVSEMSKCMLGLGYERKEL